MKKILLIPMFAGMLITGCNEDSAYLAVTDTEMETRQKVEKVSICHMDKESMEWVLLSLPSKALQAHLNHGDINLNDEDGDGYYPPNECGFEPMGDCKDDDPLVYPGAPDDCLDNIDSDCNGQELPCSISCYAGLDCCFCSILDNIRWTSDAFYCVYDFGYAVQYYLCPDGDCLKWIETVIYPSYPVYNYCSYSLGNGQVIDYFDNTAQAQACTNFLLNTADNLKLQMYCFPRLKDVMGGGIPAPPNYGDRH
jgi:hypothetical protein